MQKRISTATSKSEWTVAAPNCVPKVQRGECIRTKVSRDDALASLKMVVPKELNRVPARFISTTYTIYTWSVFHMTKYLLWVLYDSYTDPI